MHELERCCKGLADQSRLRIINLLMHGELCGCDVQYVLQASQPNVSRHLTYLKNAGLVEDRRDGNRVFYRLAGAPGGGTPRALLESLRPLLQAEPAFVKDTVLLKKAIKDGCCTVSEWLPCPPVAGARRNPKRI